MKIQLFVPPKGYIAQRWDEGSSMPPLGILYLAAVLERAGHEVQVVPSDILNYTFEEVTVCIQDFKPDIVGVTTTTENRFDSFRVMDIAKQVNPEIVTLMGGPHVSMAKADTVDKIASVDIAIIGEGENTILEIAEAVKTGDSFKKIKGIYYREEGVPVFTGRREQITDLDSLPLPARHLVPVEKYNFFIKTRDGKKRTAHNIMTSRGCPFDCYFCATPVNWGRAMRGRSPENVLMEIEHLIDKYGAEFIWFYDDTLNYNKERTHKIMDMIIERKLNIKFANEFRIDLVDKPLLEKMKEAGLEMGYFGIEAGNSRVRREIVRKQFDIELAHQFVRWSKEIDFIAGPFFIFSHFTETWAEAQETIKIMKELRAINPQIDISTAILHVYPGTPLEIIAKENGLFPADFSWSLKEEMKRVNTLPAAQGDVPLFKDKLTWWQIADLIMKFSSTSKKSVSVSKVKKTLQSLKKPEDIYINFVFFMTLLKYKCIRLVNKPD